jgi:hypothetical protein
MLNFKLTFTMATSQHCQKSLFWIFLQFLIFELLPFDTFHTFFRAISPI